MAMSAALALSAAIADAQPEVTLISPQDGAVLANPPHSVRLCFSEPVATEKTSDFDFSLLAPEGESQALRIAFDPDRRGVDIQVNIPKEPPMGEWTFEWMITAATGERSSGTAHFQVEEGGNPPADTSSGICAEGGAAPASSRSGGDDGTDVTTILVAVFGSLAGTAVLFSLLFLGWRRLGR